MLKTLRFNSICTLVFALVVIVGAAGCDTSSPRFRLNRVQLKKLEVEDVHVQPIADALEAMFGTPDEPFFLLDASLAGVVDIDQLDVAAGPVRTDEHGLGMGLYRRHCVHCHGVTGDGKGPTAAFLNPYPRDFRMGKYKFKSTIAGARPTDEDLHRTLMEGVPGTAMPSFKLLDSGERDALVNYVKYLSIRGQAERGLIEEAAELTDEDEFKPDYDLLVGTILTDIVDAWKSAVDNVTELPDRPRFAEDFDLQASINIGRELYFGGAAICAKCHGDTQLGDGQTTDFDDWGKEYHDWSGTEEENRQKMNELFALGGLEPRNAIPRNLRDGVFRGGRRPADIFYKIKNGIEGTPMPAANMNSLTTDDLWHLVNYVQSLQYDDMSRPGLDNFSTYQRERL